MNNLERSRTQQLTHGIPYKPRNKQPSMFQILSWNAGSEKPQRNYNQQQQQQNCHYQSNSPIKTVNNQHHSKQNYQDKSKQKVPQLNFIPSPHKYKHQLYMYNDEQNKAKKIIQQTTQNLLRKQLSSKQKEVKISEKSKSKSLNPNNVDDAAQIQNRKKKIDKFKMLSRQLPDSAFTTYFGKPAFSNYGTGSTSVQKKTFNVMPHAGKNHPQYQQSYQGALKKGKQINANYVPKNPMQIYHPSDQTMGPSEYYQIPIKRPNLINTTRFTEDRSYLQRKARTPKHNQLNPIHSRQSLHGNYKFKASHNSDKNKLQKVKSLTGYQMHKNQHPLVQSRDNLRQILDEKKKQQNRLAYKVTECYPLKYQYCGKQCDTKCSKWSEVKPAGITSPRSDHAKDVFYPNNIWS